MSVMFVVSTLGGGGAERVLCEMANYVVQEDEDVCVATLGGEESEDQYVIDRRIRRLRLNVMGDTRGIFQAIYANFNRVLTLRRVIKEEKPTAVVSFLTNTNVLVLLASRILGVKVVVSERIDPRADVATKRYWKVLRKLVYSWADTVVAQTESARKWLEAECGAPVICIPNHLRTLPNIDVDRKPTLVSVGRLDPWRQKGFDLLIEAFSRIHERFPDWTVLIVGEMRDNERFGELRHLLEERGLEGKVKFAGRVREVERCLAEAGLVVQFSRFEGFPNVLLEAMGMGAPVVSSNCRSGPSDLIVDGVNGRLVATGDVDRLTEVLVELLSDPSLRDRLGKAARDVRDKYQLSTIMERWEKLFGLSSKVGSGMARA